MNQKSLFLFLCITLVACNAKAQRYSTSSNFNFSAGILEKGYTANFGYEKFFTSKTSLSIGANYLNRTQKIKNVSTNAELSSYFLDAKYKFYPMEQRSIFPYLGGGFFGGYQTFDNKKNYPQTLKIGLDDSIIYGIIGEVGIEYNILSFSFVLNATPLYEIKTEKILLPIRLGMKYFY
ncbi:MAG: hypothetical protein LBV43_06070 [Prevotella sp.]|jgi:outer membrane protein W|nr:hypothetical protein [Prevotella sp.]